MLGTTVLGIALCMVVCAMLLKMIGMPVHAMATVQLASFPNGGNLGLPISYLAYGVVGLFTAAAFFDIVSFLTHTVSVRTLPNTQGVGS